MWLQVRSYVIVSISSILVTLIGMMIWNHHQLASLKDINEQLKKDRIAIVDELNTNQIQLNKDIAEKFL